MKVMKKIISLLAIVLLFSACDDMFAPAPENNRNLDQVVAQPDYSQGLLGYAYEVVNDLLPIKSVSDVATDDAVTNDVGNAYLQMATGSWTAINNPISQWDRCLATIQYLNLFLANADKTTWAHDEIRQLYYITRMSGEAYAMRALYWFYLLQAHAGKDANGTLLGIPIFKEAQDINSDFNLPRNTFQESITAILEDLDKAISLLPMDYADLTDASQIPANYQALGADLGNYNHVCGIYFKGRMSARIAQAIKAQVALMASSPAYQNPEATITWADAANYAATVIQNNGGLAGMADNGWTWYSNTSEIAAGNYVPKEILWTDKASNGTEDWNVGIDIEDKNWPPSLFGNGRINPSQNLVDAFPMADGYPISESPGYNEQQMYENRDPRLSQYILYNGATYKNSTIITGTYSENNDGLNKDASVSTRTGYYLRKLMREDVNLVSTSRQGQYHYPLHIRYTEIFLIYAEAANEAWGPTAAGSAGYSAYDVIKKIRARAGVGASNGDAYLESIKNDQAKMRDLIRNERRIELCFENKRFWDLRRWGLPLGETVKGVQIDQKTDGTLTYTFIDVEQRTYQSYMNYGPIPYSEVMKYSNLQQNQGW
jgi:hypothetical protein